MDARYYDPVIGRFYSNDPVGFTNVHTFNRYGYANNNPYKYVDPDGRETRLMVDAHHLDMDVVEGRMTMEERNDISQAQFTGMASGIVALRIGSLGINLVKGQLAKRSAQNAIIKKLTKGLRKQIEAHKQKIKKERSLGTKPEMVGKTTKKQQRAQLKNRRQKHKRDIKDWQKQIKQIEREVRSQ